MVNNNCLINNMSSDEIINNIQKYFKEEKVINLEIIKNICEKLITINPNIFKNPTYKWLDPSVGLGIFPIIVYELLNGSKASFSV